ncbi:MAG: T9SS type A sorting domain-containing protein [Saprospirales bacterium]|nr:T9SS type A sorting domain-containing protein [Saprospirales bacterium]
MKNFMTYKFILWVGLALSLGVSLLVLQAPPKALPEGEDEEGSLAQTIERRYYQEFLMTRDPALNEVPHQRMLKAFQIAQDKRSMRAPDDLPIFWEERGPNNVGGRTRGILVDANDPSGQTVWAGSVSGGLWRTNNIDAAAPNWVPINDLFQNLALSSIAQDPTNFNNLYFGTGECWGNFDAVQGLGAWNSSDGGATWQRMPNMDGGGNPCIAKIVVDNNGTVFAATTNGLRFFNPLLATWPTINIGAASNFITDLEIAANGDMYASTFADGVYLSTNNGSNWNPINTGLPTQNFGRVELACAPSNPNVAYVIFADTTTATSGNCLSFFQTTNSGGNWIAGTCPAGFGKQAWYDLILAVDPTNANRVWAGGVGLFLSTDGGMNWAGVGSGHSDHHALVYYPNDSSQLLVGSDGGMYKFSNADAAAPTVADKNNTYNVTQFFAVDMHPDVGSNVMLGGTQDNATPVFSAAGVNSTTCVLCCCDGGWAFIDEDSPMTWIASTQDGSFNVSTDGGGSFSNIVPGNSSRLFITPAEYDDAANVLYYSDTRGRFGRVTDVGGANTNSSDTIPAFAGNIVSAFEISPTVANRVYMGTWNGALFQVDNADQVGTATVTALNNPPVGGFISSITVEPTNESHILITFSNYGVNSVWESPDGGTTWNSIEGDLPDMPIRWIIFWPGETDKAMVATELGVWYAKDLDGANTVWYPTNESGLANVRTDMLRARVSDKMVTAATHGRGMYSSDYFALLDACHVSYNLPGNVPSGLYMASDFVTSSGTVADGSTVTFQAGDEVSLLPDFTAERGSNLWALIKECTPEMPPLVVNVGTSVGAKEGAKDFSPLLTPPEESAGMPTLRVRGVQVIPNPTRTEGTVQFELSDPGYARLYLMNARGELVASLIDGYLDAGPNYRTFDATGLSAGIYLVVLKTAGETRTERVVIVE